MHHGLAIQAPSRRHRRGCLALTTALCAAFLGLPGPAVAQSQAEGWRHSLSVYGWFTGVESRVATPLGKVETELSFADVVEDLDVGFFAAYSARNGPWGVFVDLNYSALTSVEPTPFGVAFEEGRVESTLTIASAVGTYAVYEDATTRIDIAGGLRAYRLELDTRLVGVPGIRDRTFSTSESWVDPVVGVRARTELSDTWFLDAAADVGGFGIGDASDLSWQAYAGVGYRLNERWSFIGGYRHLSIDTEIDGADVDLSLSGLLLGATFAF